MLGPTGRVSLKYRLPISYAAVAVLTMLVLGAILLVVLSNYYAGAETAYLNAGADRVVRELSRVDWNAVSAGQNPDESLAAKQRTLAVALVTQLRIQVVAQDGKNLVDSGSPASIEPSVLMQMGQQGTSGSTSSGPGDGFDSPSDGPGPPLGLPSPLGPGLFGGAGSGDVVRSHRAMERALTQDGQTVATVNVSEGPAYGATVIRNTLKGWLIAGFAAVLLSAGLGWWVSSRLTRPLIEITTASDSMAGGNLAARADVRRSDELGRLADSFNSMAASVQQNVSALQRFVADAAHELGTPLTALEADLDLALDRSESEEQRRLVSRAMRQAKRLERLSADLLQLSRLDTGTFAGPPKPLDLVTLVHHVADAVASRAEQARLDLTIDVPDGEVWALGHEERLRAAVTNLADNSLKFTPAGGSITLGLAAAEGRARLWVQDTGIGIPPEDMEGLFGRFHRARNVSAYPGSGLGLAIVKATAELHGGWVRAENVPHGSRFELTLPTS